MPETIRDDSIADPRISQTLISSTLNLIASKLYSYSSPAQYQHLPFGEVETHAFATNSDKKSSFPYCLLIRDACSAMATVFPNRRGEQRVFRAALVRNSWLFVDRRRLWEPIRNKYFIQIYNLRHLYYSSYL